MGPTALVGFEPVNLGTKDQYATPRPPLIYIYIYIVGFCLNLLKLHKFYVLYPLKTKHRLLYLKTQSVPRCKHFSSRL
jgi:hypothetical protein